MSESSSAEYTARVNGEKNERWALLFCLAVGSFGVGAEEVGEVAQYFSAVVTIPIEVVASTRRGMATQHVKIERKSRDFKWR